MAAVRIEIRNFQSIDELDLEIHGFSTISGKSNIGKSALLRAVSGALLNKPVTNLVRHGAKSCSVRVASEGWGLLWEKAEKGLNRYTIDGKAERLENVGQRQPEAVSSMGFSSIRIGDRDLHPWYASQWSPLFLLDEGGPTVTQFISEISGLNVLQDAISLGVKGKKKALDEAKSAFQEAEQLLDKIDGLEDLDGLLEVEKDLDGQAKSIAEYEANIGRGREFQSLLSKTAASIRILIDAASIPIPLNGMGGEVTKALKMQGTLLLLRTAAKGIIAMKSAPSIPIPDLPEEDHGMWSRLQRFSGMDSLKDSVEKLDGVKSVNVPILPEKSEVDRTILMRRMLDQIESTSEEVLKDVGLVRVPDPLDDSIAATKRMKTLLASIEAARRGVSAVSSDVSIPDDPGSASDLSRMLKAKAAAAAAKKTKSEIDKMGRELEKTSSELSEVERQLSEIPSCPTCNRPVLNHGLSPCG